MTWLTKEESSGKILQDSSYAQESHEFRVTQGMQEGQRGLQRAEARGLMQDG